MKDFSLQVGMARGAEEIGYQVPVDQNSRLICVAIFPH